MTIEVWEVKKPDAWSVFIDPFFDANNLRRGRQPIISVNSQEDWSFVIKDNAWNRASVSWSSLGPVSPAFADIFATALSIAVGRAQKMDIEHKYEVTA